MFTALRQRKGAVLAVIASVVLHAALLMLSLPVTPPPETIVSDSRLQIELVAVPKQITQIEPAPETETSETNLEQRPPKESLELLADEAITPLTGSAPDDQPSSTSQNLIPDTASDNTTDSNQVLDSTTLRELALLSARQVTSQSNETLETAGLPGNWTQDAIPAKLAARENVLDPLTYYGGTNVDQWESSDGKLHKRTTLADGTIVCSDQFDTSNVPGEIETRFSAQIMLHKTCGKAKGGRESKNKLAKYHPAYNEPNDNSQ